MNPAPQPAPRAPRGPLDPAYLKFASAGLQFALTFLVCGAIGWWLDRKFGSDPWLMIGGILLGAGGAMYSLVRRLESLTPPKQPKPPHSDRSSQAPR